MFKQILQPMTSELLLQNYKQQLRDQRKSIVVEFVKEGHTGKSYVIRSAALPVPKVAAYTDRRDVVNAERQALEVCCDRNVEE